MILTKYHHGLRFQYQNLEIFFGNRFVSKTSLIDLYPYKFIELQQTHEDQLIEHSLQSVANDNSTTVLTMADAHFTSNTGLGLLIKSADCMPLFVFDHQRNKVLAIHAGWRGIANQITPKSILKVFPNAKELTIIIGPFIRKESFVVDSDVMEKIISLLEPKDRQPCYAHSEIAGKYLIDLKLVLMGNLRNRLPETKFNFIDVELNTVTDGRFHSFRRDKDKSGRNYSFILIKK